jgi:hypothetical protein
LALNKLAGNVGIDLPIVHQKEDTLLIHE